MPFRYPQYEIEERLRKEFQAAFNELERASDKDEAAALARLNRATRRLDDFVGYGKVPQELRPQRSVKS
jgi:hypothetical protein